MVLIPKFEGDSESGGAVYCGVLAIEMMPS